MENYEYLQHAGVKGMKWGQRRYQHKDGSLTTLGKIHYRTNKDFRVKVKRQESAKKAREAKEAKKKHEEDKQKAIKSGSATEVLKYKGEYTKAEMDQIQARLNWEQSIKNISDREIASGKSKVGKVFDKIGNATDYAEKAIKAYNTLANVYNGVKGDHILPKIDTNITNNNINERKKAKKEKQKEKEAEDKRKQQEAEGPAKRAERAKKKAEQEAAEKAKQAESKKTEATKNKSEKNETFEGTVEGVGTSRGSQTKNTKKSKPDDYYDPIDSTGEWVNESTSNIPAVYTNSGRSRVNNYLEDYGMLLLEDLNR